MRSSADSGSPEARASTVPAAPVAGAADAGPIEIIDCADLILEIENKEMAQYVGGDEALTVAAIDTSLGISARHVRLLTALARLSLAKSRVGGAVVTPTLHWRPENQTEEIEVPRWKSVFRSLVQQLGDTVIGRKRLTPDFILVILKVLLDFRHVLSPAYVPKGQLRMSIKNRHISLAAERLLKNFFEGKSKPPNITAVVSLVHNELCTIKDPRTGHEFAPGARKTRSDAGSKRPRKQSGDTDSPCRMPQDVLDEYEALCGVSYAVVNKLAKFTDIPVDKVCAVLRLLRLNLPFSAAGFMCTPPVSGRTIEHWVQELGGALSENPIMQPAIRFNHMHEGWPWVTAQINCTTVPCRHRHSERTETDDGNTVVASRDRTYSGRHRDHVWKYEIYTTHQGLPFAFRGPVFGSIHDTKLFKSPGEPFVHAKKELFIADLGYQSCPHCLVHFRKGAKELTPLQRGFTRHHRKLRSRIERTFAWLDKFTIMSGTDHDQKFMRHAMTIILNTVFLAEYNAVRYPDAVGVLPAEERLQCDDCWCQSGCGVPPVIDKAELQTWAELPQFATDPHPDTKEPSKRKGRGESGGGSAPQ
jgi:hypothetical protein